MLNSELLFANLSNPTLLFFLLGMCAVLVRSDLEIPAPSIRFISVYLLFSIGFKGGLELAHQEFSGELVGSLAFGLAASLLIPVVVYFVARFRLKPEDSAAVAATYGSVSAVTFVTAASYLETFSIPYSGSMVAVMALMEAPAIVVSVLLMKIHDRDSKRNQSIRSILKHSLSNGSVFLILGSLFIGSIANAKQAEGIRPFTTDIFKGFLVIFMLEMGMTTARRLQAFRSNGAFVIFMGLFFPILFGSVAAFASGWVTQSEGDRLMLSVLSASASYIAVPAAAKVAFPKADPGIFVPMALGITFPLNVTVGLPLYLTLVQKF
jgi:hypothetical protein